jgi:hypothetical protein
MMKWAQPRYYPTLDRSSETHYNTMTMLVLMWPPVGIKAYDLVRLKGRGIEPLF